MIKLNKIHQNKKRVGRGIAAGQGKTAGRGTKGQNSRTGKKRHSGFTTGATPLHMKLPKIDGNKVVKKYITLTTDQIDKAEIKEVSLKTLQEKGLVSKRITSNTVVKVVLGKKQAAPYQFESAIAHSKKVAVVARESA